MYGPAAYVPHYDRMQGAQNAQNEGDDEWDEEELWKDSPWPPRNAPAFDLLNAFMER